MKNTITPIIKQARYAEAAEILKRLEQEFAETREEEQRIVAILSSLDKSLMDDPLTVAMRMLDDNLPPKTSIASLQEQHSEIKAKQWILRQAIEQQRATLDAISSILSAEQAAAHRTEHAHAVRTISAALKSLDDALASESAIRYSLETAGYSVRLPSFDVPELGRMTYDSPMVRHYRAATDYVVDHDDDIGGKLDKTATVHLLVDVPGVGSVGDVVSLEGRFARHLVRSGRVEETTEKVQHTVKDSNALPELVLE